MGGVDGTGERSSDGDRPAARFEIISLGTNRPHMDLPQFKEAAARLEAVQQQTAAVEREVAELERQRDALKGTVRLLKEADRVNAPLHDIQPERRSQGQ